MGTAIGLREDFDAAGMRRLARASRSANQARRLLSLAQIYDGGSRSDAARTGGVGLQIFRDWVMRFNARGPDGLLDGKAPGKRSILNDAQRRALVEIVEHGPISAIDGLVRWRRPVRRLVRRALLRQADHLIDTFLRRWGLARGTGRVRQEPCDASISIPRLPSPDRRLGFGGCRHDPLRPHTVIAQQHDPGTPDVFLR